MATASGIRVRLPAAFRGAAGGRAEVRVAGRNVGEVLAALCRAHPELGGRLLGPDGAPRRYVSLFVNDEDVRQLGGVDAPLQDGDELTVVPALSGGEAPAGQAEGQAGGALEGEALERALAAIGQLAEAAPDAEVCGFVLGSRGGEALEVLAARNTAREPARAFEVDPADTLRALRRADEEGRALVAIYHSHPKGGASLSAADVAQLTAAGEPLLPGVELWVVGLDEGRAVEFRAYRWTRRGYVERARRAAPFTARERAAGAGPA